MPASVPGRVAREEHRLGPAARGLQHACAPARERLLHERRAGFEAGVQALLELPGLPLAAAGLGAERPDRDITFK